MVRPCSLTCPSLLTILRPTGAAPRRSWVERRLADSTQNPDQAAKQIRAGRSCHGDFVDRRSAHPLIRDAVSIQRLRASARRWRCRRIMSHDLVVIRMPSTRFSTRSIPVETPLARVAHSACDCRASIQRSPHWRSAETSYAQARSAGSCWDKPPSRSDIRHGSLLAHAVDVSPLAVAHAVATLPDQQKPAVRHGSFSSVFIADPIRPPPQTPALHTLGDIFTADRDP